METKPIFTITFNDSYIPFNCFNDGAICTTIAEFAFNLTFARILTIALLQQDVLQVKERVKGVNVHPTMEPVENPHHECYM